MKFRTAHISTTISISLVLFLVGLTMILLLNAGHLSTSLRENISLSVLIETQAKHAEVQKLKKELDLAPYILEAEYVSKEDAADKLQKELGENFIDVLGYNPLPTSIDIHLLASYTNPDSILAIENKLKQSPVVKGVFYPKTIVSSLSSNIRKVSFLMLFFAGLLLLVTIGLINNSVRISIYADRFLIRTQELVGATRLFISRPYVVQAIVQGMIGGFAAIALMTGFIWLVQEHTGGFLNTQNLLLVYVTVLLLGSLIAAFASYFAVSKYLNIRLDQLYK